MRTLYLLILHVLLILFPHFALAAYTEFSTSGFETYHVTNTSLSGAGSFPAALSAGSRIIVFDSPGMVINGAGVSYHILENTVIDGAGNSAYPTISGIELLIHSPTGASGSETIENVKIKGVRFRAGKSYGDFVQIGYNAANVSVENCTFEAYEGGDGSVDITYGSRDVDIKYNMFFGNYGPGVSLAAFEVWGIRYHHNIWSNNYSRSPNIATFEESSTVNPGVTQPVADIRYNIYNDVHEGPTLVGDATVNIAYNLIKITDPDHRHNTIMVWDVGRAYDYPIAKLYSAYIQGNASVNDCRLVGGGWNITGVNSYSNHAEYVNLKTTGPTLTDKLGVIDEWQDAKDHAGFGAAHDNTSESTIRSAVTVPDTSIFDFAWNVPSDDIAGAVTLPASFRIPGGVPYGIVQ